MAESEQLIKHIWVITGPAGCGKTTVANHLASALKLPYIEGDEVRCIQYKSNARHTKRLVLSFIRLRASKRCIRASH